MLTNLASLKKFGHRKAFRYSPHTLRVCVRMLIKCGKTQYRRFSSLFMMPCESTAQKYDSLRLGPPRCAWFFTALAHPACLLQGEKFSP